MYHIFLSRKIYHTDDEIALAIARLFHVLHSGALWPLWGGDTKVNITHAKPE